MGAFEKTDGPANNEDIIVIHLGRVLTDAEYNSVVQSIIAFMNKRWPNCQYTIPS